MAKLSLEIKMERREAIFSPPGEKPARVWVLYVAPDRYGNPKALLEGADGSMWTTGVEFIRFGWCRRGYAKI